MRRALLASFETSRCVLLRTVEDLQKSVDYVKKKIDRLEVGVFGCGELLA